MLKRTASTKCGLLALLILTSPGFALAEDGSGIIIYGEGGIPYVHNCGYEGFFDRTTSTYGVFKINAGPAPTEGSKIDGDLTQLHQAVTIRNLSDDTSVQVTVIFNNATIDGADSKLRELGCTKY